MRLCYSIYMNAWSNLRTCVTSLCKQIRARMRTLALKNLILTILTPFSLIFSSNSPFNALFSSLYRSCLPSQVGVAPTVLLYGRVLIEETMDHIRASGFKPITHLLLETSTSAILVQCLVERWWDTTYTFHVLIRRWWWLLMTFNGWPVLGAMDVYQPRRFVGHAIGHRVSWEEVLDRYDPLLWHWDRLQAFPADDS